MREILTTDCVSTVPFSSISDPELWTEDHTLHWLIWASGEFANEALDHVKDIVMTGREMCALTKEEFCERFQKESEDLFWTHLELLKRSEPSFSHFLFFKFVTKLAHSI